MVRGPQEYIIGDAIVPMNIHFTVYSQSFIIRQLFAPFFLITVHRPIVSVESTPQNCSSVSVKILLRYNAAVTGFNIHYTYGIICFSANRNGISADDIKEKILAYACNG